MLKDDVIFNNTNSEELVGRTGVWHGEQKAVLSNHMSIIRVMDQSLADPAFISFFLHFQWINGTAQRLCRRHVNQASITLDKLFSLGFPDISISEQRTIARILSLVQQAIQTQERVIATTTELKNALMQKLFTEGTRGEAQKDVADIGRVPQSWEVVNLSQTGDVIYGIQAAVASNLSPVGTKILTNINITLDGRIDLEKVRYYQLQSVRDRTTILQKGDILFNWRSGSKEHVGKTALFNLEGTYTHSSFILRIRPNSTIDNRYLFFYLNYLRETGYFVRKQTYSINAKFNKSAIEILPVALPLLPEQKLISDALETVTAKLAHHRHKQATLTALFQSLLHGLMTGAVRVSGEEAAAILKTE